MGKEEEFNLSQRTHSRTTGESCREESIEFVRDRQSSVGTWVEDAVII